MTPPLSVVLIVKNEHDRLPHALASASFAEEIVVADTGSTDGTQEIARAAGAHVVEIPWEGFVASRNRALAHAANDWVFVLDADERVSSALRAAVRSATENPQGAAGFRMPRLSYFLGREVRHGTWYPNWQMRLGRRSAGIRAAGGRVHEAYVVDGRVGKLPTPLLHDPYRDISEALRKAAAYARLGAEDRWERGHRGSVTGLLVRPAVEFLRCYLLKAGFLDGVAGFDVAMLHASAYFLRAAYLLERERGKGGHP